MVVEVVQVRVKAGQEEAYQRALKEAFAVLARQPGCLSQRAFRCIEDPQIFNLVIEWEKIEDHTEGFRNSKDIEVFRDIVASYYEQGPQVKHFGETKVG